MEKINKLISKMKNKNNLIATSQKEINKVLRLGQVSLKPKKGAKGTIIFLSGNTNLTLNKLCE